MQDKKYLESMLKEISDVAKDPIFQEVLLRREARKTRKIVFVLQINKSNFKDRETDNDIIGISIQTTDLIVERDSNTKGIEIVKYSVVGTKFLENMDQHRNAKRWNRTKQ